MQSHRAPMIMGLALTLILLNACNNPTQTAQSASPLPEDETPPTEAEDIFRSN